jgi:hypothetical protein
VTTTINDAFLKPSILQLFKHTAFQLEIIKKLENYECSWSKIHGVLAAEKIRPKIAVVVLARS